MKKMPVILKGLVKAQELQKIQSTSTYPSKSLAIFGRALRGNTSFSRFFEGNSGREHLTNNGEFNINLNPIHLDKTESIVKSPIAKVAARLLNKKDLNRGTKPNNTHLSGVPLVSNQKNFSSRVNIHTTLDVPSNKVKFYEENDLNKSREVKLYKNMPFITVDNTSLTLLNGTTIETSKLKTPLISEEAKMIFKDEFNENTPSLNNKKSSLEGSTKEGLTNNINHISISPNIGSKSKKGVLLKYQKVISYKFNHSNLNPINQTQISSNIKSNNGNFFKKAGVIYSYNQEVKDTYKLLFYFFKSIYCLISKLVFLHTPDKVIIQLFYYLSIPKKKVFKFFSVMYINSFKKKWLNKKSQAISLRKNNSLSLNKITHSSRVHGGDEQGKLFIKWRVLKSISRLRSKTDIVRSLLFNLRKFNIIKVFNRKFYLITQILSRKFNKCVELQLIRLHHPYHDTNILINLLSLNIRNKTKNARVAINKIYAKNQIKIINDPNLNPINLIPAYLSGIYIKIAGRLMREPIIPRLTSKVYEKGASSTGKVNFLDTATITKKNRKGAYTIKIKTGQNFFMPTLKERKYSSTLPKLNSRDSYFK